MMKLKMISLAMLMIQFIAASASETTLWKGSKKFASWSDQLTIAGSKFSSAKADDVLCLSITASSGAQLQLSWGSSWTCFEGLDYMDIKGDYEMVLTTQALSRVKQDIHIKGVNFTLTAVTLKSNDGKYTTQSESLFAWKDMLISGATQGQSCTIGLEAYGGAGWYWSEPADLSEYGSVVIELLQPAAETIIAQLLYNDQLVKRLAITKGATQCKITLSSAHKNVYSVNIISEKAQTVAIGSVNVTDKEGKVVPTLVGSIPASNDRLLSTEYYNTAGERLSCAHHGINIVKKNFEGGRSIVRKEVR